MHGKNEHLAKECGRDTSAIGLDWIQQLRCSISAKQRSSLISSFWNWKGPLELKGQACLLSMVFKFLLGSKVDKPFVMDWFNILSYYRNKPPTDSSLSIHIKHSWFFIFAMFVAVCALVCASVFKVGCTNPKLSPWFINFYPVWFLDTFSVFRPSKFWLWVAITNTVEWYSSTRKNIMILRSNVNFRTTW